MSELPLTIVAYTGDGATTDRTIPFSYDDPSEVQVLVDGVETEFTLPSASIVRISPAPETGARILIRKNTAREYPIAWQSSAMIKGGDLNTVARTAIDIGIEAKDRADVALDTASGLQEQIDEKADDAAVTAALAGKADSSHTHTTSDVTGLDAALAAKANSSDVTTALAAKANTADLGDLATKNKVAVTDLDTTGTRDGTKYLRDDGAWVTPAGGGGGGGGDMLGSNNLAEITDAAAARTNIGAASAADLDAAEAAIDALDSALAAKANSSDVTTALAGKANSTHTHAQSDITNLTTDLAAKVATSLTISTSGLASGGGDLSANRTINVPAEDAAGFRTGTATNEALTAGGVYSAAAIVTLTDASTIAVNMATFINAQVTLGGNRTLGNPTNPKVGQTGTIDVIQDDTGGRTLAFGSNWKSVGGEAPEIDTTAGAVTALHYRVRSSTFIEVAASAGLA